MAEPRSRTPDRCPADRIQAARQAAALRLEEARAQRSAEAQVARDRAARRRAALAKVKAAAVVVENHAAVARQRRMEGNRKPAATPTPANRTRKQVRLRVISHEHLVDKIKLRFDRAEDTVRVCRANCIRHQYRLYRRRRTQRMANAARLLQSRWRGGRCRCMLKESLAARTLQAAWREYAARLAAARGDLVLVLVVRLQRAYFRAKRRRCELLYQLAVEAKEAACMRMARIQVRAQAARALAFAEETAKRKALVKEFRIRRQKVAKRRRILRTAVRLIKAHQEQEERQTVRALEIEYMERILRKYLRQKLLRRLAAQSFVSERVGRINRELAACQRTIKRALHSAESSTRVTKPGRSRPATSSPAARAPLGRSEGRGCTVVSDIADGWDWCEGDNIIRSLHLRKVLSSTPSQLDEGMGKDELSQRRDLAEMLGQLPSPQQNAVVAMLAMTCPDSCVDRSAPGKPQELVVDLGQVDEQVLREALRAAKDAENTASAWKPTGMAVPRTSTASSVSRSQRQSKLGNLAQIKAPKKPAQRDVSDGATNLRRTLRSEFKLPGCADAHAHERGRKFSPTSCRGSATVRDSHCGPSKGGLEQHDERVLWHLALQQRTVNMRLQSPYNRRLSPLPKRRDDRMAAIESLVYDDSEWVTRQLQHQAPILCGLANSSSPPPSRDVGRRALKLGMQNNCERSSPAYREQWRRERADAYLLGRIRQSRAMQEEMEHIVCDAERDLIG